MMGDQMSELPNLESVFDTAADLPNYYINHKKFPIPILKHFSYMRSLSSEI